MQSLSISTPSLPLSKNHAHLPLNPRHLFLPILPSQSTFTCSGVRLSPACFTSLDNNAALHHWKLRSAALKNFDVATLGNLCVDIVLNVPKLPPRSPDARQAYMEQLAASPPDKRYWEAGGNCNMAIAAARLGLNCAAIGHVGSEIYGKFLLDVLRDEGIRKVGMTEEIDSLERCSTFYETLLCWVLVDPSHRHGFCSRADFDKEPAFSWVKSLSPEVKMAIKQSKVLFCNGYGFDDLSPSLITSAVNYAVDVGTSVFFDPGPRGKSLSSGTPEEQKAFHHLLKMSDALLLTSDEAEALTGIEDPILAGQELLKNGLHTKWVIVKMGPKGSILITAASISCAPAFKVNVADTVGCGDSYVAAIAFGFIHNMPLVNTLTIANAVGAATAMGCGAGRNVAKLKKVVELVRGSNINEDDEFWDELLAKHLNVLEINFLSKQAINGTSNRLNRVALGKVVSELLPILESTQLEGKVVS